MGNITGKKAHRAATYPERSSAGGAVGPTGPTGPSGGPPGPTGPTGATGPAGAALGAVLITAVSAPAPTENMLVEVTTPNGVVITIGAGVSQVTIKDKSGSANPIIGVTAANGATLEDPNNIGVTADYAATVYVKGQGSAVTFRFDGINYQVVSSA